MKECKYCNNYLCEHPLKGKRFDSWVAANYIEECNFFVNQDYHLCKLYVPKGV